MPLLTGGRRGPQRRWRLTGVQVTKTAAAVVGAGPAAAEYQRPDA